MKKGGLLHWSSFTANEARSLLRGVTGQRGWVRRVQGETSQYEKQCPRGCTF
mgnify:CR=1 FL=1